MGKYGDMGNFFRKIPSKKHKKNKMFLPLSVFVIQSHILLDQQIIL
ncbi:MAG: hypothetical protein RIR11_892 [Bacteroidota bacterium]|jgi:hypothetical protein